MANLFWKSKAKIKSLLESPFQSEEEFEKTVFNTSEILEEITLADSTSKCPPWAGKMRWSTLIIVCTISHFITSCSRSIKWEKATTISQLRIVS